MSTHSICFHREIRIILIRRSVLSSGIHATAFALQSNLNSSNTDGSFTMINSNSFLSPYEILPIAQENKH